MTIPKQKFREVVLLLLFSYDSLQTNEVEIEALIMETLHVSRKVVADAFARMQCVIDKIPEIDPIIQDVSKSYALDRIYRLEKNVLRLGVYEILFDEEIPPKVAIHEAMRLARKFSTKEAALFVNAVLDSIFKGQQGLEIDVNDIQEKALNLLKAQALAENPEIVPLKEP